MSLSEILKRREQIKKEIDQIDSSRAASDEDVSKQALKDAARWIDVKERVDKYRARMASADAAESASILSEIAQDKDVIELFIASFPADSAAFEIPAKTLEENAPYQRFQQSGDWSKVLAEFTEAEVIGRYRDLTDAKKVMTYFYILMIKSLPEPTNADLAARDLRESQPSKSAIEPVRHAESISDPKAVDSTTKQVLSSYGMTPHRILPEGGEGGSRFGMSVTER